MVQFVQALGRLHHVAWHPGNGSRPIIFANSLGTDFRIWDDVVAALPDTVPHLRMDKSGHGLSEGGAESIEGYAADVAAIMDRFGLNDALICGVSVGGMIAQALAQARPDLVAGLLLSNTSYRIGTAESWADRIQALDQTGLAPMADGIMERWFSPRFRREQPEDTFGYRTMLARTPVPGYRATCAAIRDADLTSAARGISCPTVCVAGSDDQATPPDTVRVLADMIAGATYLCIDEAGHLPCIEAPEMITKTLLELYETLP